MKVREFCVTRCAYSSGGSIRLCRAFIATLAKDIFQVCSFLGDLKKFIFSDDVSVVRLP